MSRLASVSELDSRQAYKGTATELDMRCNALTGILQGTSLILYVVLDVTTADMFRLLALE